MNREPDTASLRRPDGTVIAYDVAGSGPPVVLLHGLTGERRRWTPVTDLLTEHCTCIRIDARGHGESSASASYSVPAMAGDVAAVVRELGIEGAAVVGSSLGGTTAVLLALTRSTGPVVVVDQPLRPSAFAARIRALEPRLRGAGFFEAMVEFEDSLDLGPLPEPARAALHGGLRAADPRLVLELWAPLLSATDDDLDTAMGTGLRHLRAPLLCLHGSAPAPGYETWLHAHVPHARLEVWEGTGHLLHLVDPARFAERVRRFVAAPGEAHASG